jgi:hypothetical protein
MLLLDLKKSLGGRGVLGLQQMLLLKIPAKQGIIAEGEAKKHETDIRRDERQQ